jgi:hypothetical protein
MTGLSPFRLNLLRTGYIILIVGLGTTIWPSILDPARSWALMNGVVVSMLGAMSALAVLGIRYPLAMLPLLFFEMGWKAIWLLRVALPLWSGNRLDPATTETLYECLLIIVFPIIIPWPYVFDNYFRKPGDAWRRRDSGSDRDSHPQPS